MSQRAARPLRLLQSCWSSSLKRHGAHALPTIAVYKPCGLPYFAASQVAACQSGRHLFSASSCNNVPAVTTTDVSDSLLSRATDLLPPGCGTPRVALPLMHPALLRNATAAEVNAITAQRKGVTLVASSPDEFVFLRNCHRLNLVRSVYRVLCRLPPCVSARVRHTLRQESVAQQTTKSAFKNPYVQEFFQRSNGAAGGADGITLGCDSSGGSGLPHCAYPHPLLRGGFIDVRERTLLRRGTVSGYISSYQLPPGVQKIVEQQERLKRLFLSPSMPSSSSPSSFSISPQSVSVDGDNANEGGCDICRWAANGRDQTSLHPWIGHECRMRVALDVKVPSEKELVTCGTHGSESEMGVCRVVGKPFQFDFSLVKLNNTCDFALYEVSTTNASDEEIKTVFAAANFFVLNDFVNDVALSEAMFRVTRQMNLLPPPKLAELSMASQHVLRHGSPVDLVAEPLMLPVDTTIESLALIKESEQQPQQTTSLQGRRYRLLLETLMNLKDEKTYFEVAQLALGSGLECAAVHFPDPAHDANKSAVQHLLLQIEERGVTEAYRNSVAERMFFVSRGTSVDCETYGVVLSADNKEYLPSQRSVAVSWGAGHPAVVRLEECGELRCAYCGALGHVWSACPDGVPLLPSAGVSSSFLAAASSVDGKNEENRAADGESHPRKKESDAIWLTTVDDVTDALADASVRRGSSDVISIPNSAPTQAFNPHAWRRNQKRPVLHKTRLRCAYCSGKHHITQCPKLSGEEVGDYMGQEVDKEKLRSDAGKLFCIKCGKRGHLYNDCPSVPRGLHTATHCPICQQPHRTVRHEPSQCPRRVTPPRECLPTGVPASFLKTRAGRVKLGRRGGGALLADTFLSQE